MCRPIRSTTKMSLAIRIWVFILFSMLHAKNLVVYVVQCGLSDQQYNFPHWDGMHARFCG